MVVLAWGSHCANVSPRWAWRDEAGNDMGIAAEIGKRHYVKD